MESDDAAKRLGHAADKINLVIWDVSVVRDWAEEVVDTYKAVEGPDSATTIRMSAVFQDLYELVGSLRLTAVDIREIQERLVTG